MDKMLTTTSNSKSVKPDSRGERSIVKGSRPLWRLSIFAFQSLDTSRVPVPYSAWWDAPWARPSWPFSTIRRGRLRTHGAAQKLTKIKVTLPAAREVPLPRQVRFNYAVNNDGDYYPRFDASLTGERSSLGMVCDGHYRYDAPPANRWTTVGSTGKSDWISVDLGAERSIDTVKLFLLDDGGKVVAPASFDLEHWDGKAWRAVPDQRRTPERPVGRRPNTITFPTMDVARLRVVFRHAEGGNTGLTEFQAWGPGNRPYRPASPPAGILSVNTTGKGFPMATASFHDRYGGVPASAIDGKIIYRPMPWPPSISITFDLPKAATTSSRLVMASKQRWVATTIGVPAGVFARSLRRKSSDSFVSDWAGLLASPS